MNTVLPNLHSDAIDFLREHAPVANPPEFPDPYTPTIKFVDSPADYLRSIGR